MSEIEELQDQIKRLWFRLFVTNVALVITILAVMFR